MSNEELIKEAIKVRENAYAKTTDYKVGAVVLTDDEKIYKGVNIEEYAIPAMSTCAERVAIQSAITCGKRNFKKIAVVGGKEDIDTTLVPCGMCLQYLLDMCPGIKVICYIDGKIVERSLLDFLNVAFELKNQIKIED